LWNVSVKAASEMISCFGDGGTSMLDVLSDDEWYTWNEHGYLYLPKFYGMETVNALRKNLDDAWKFKNDPEHEVNKLSIDILDGSPRQLFGNVTEKARKTPYKLNDLYLLSAVAREAVIGGKLSKIVEALLDAPPVVCNSLTFEYGSQQLDHFDTWYMPSRVLNGMVASWIALDEVTDNNGPLRYFPGSHKIKPFIMSPHATSLPSRLAARNHSRLPEFRTYIAKELKLRGIETPKILYAQPGDIFIWHSQLFHGGMPIKDRLATTRRALVTHYHSTRDFTKNYPSLMPVKSGSGFYKQKKGFQHALDVFP